MGRTHEDLGAARADLHDIKNPNVDRVQANFHYSLQTWGAADRWSTGGEYLYLNAGTRLPEAGTKRPPEVIGRMGIR